MAEVLTLEASLRDKLGSANARRLRRSGYTPAVLYGKKKDNVNLSLDAGLFEQALRQHTRILTVALPDGTEEQAVIKEVHWDELTDEVLHVDLNRVDLDERIELEVEIKLTGDAKGVMSQGGTLDQILFSVLVECRAGSIPDNIKFDVTKLEINDTVHVGDLTLPEGVTCLRDDEDTICTILPPKREEEEEEEAEVGLLAAGPSEPELIEKPKKDEDEG